MVTARLKFEKSESRTSRWGVDVEFDASVNYLIRKVTHYIGDSPDHNSFFREEEVVRFVEPSPGLYFPEDIAGRSGEGKKVDEGGSRTQIRKIQVNTDLPVSLFKLRFPPGTYMTDSIRKVIYRVDTDGRQASPATPLGTLPPPPPAAGEVSDPVAATEETAAEPQRRWQWWIIGVSFLMLTAAVVMVYRRRSN